MFISKKNKMYPKLKILIISVVFLSHIIPAAAFILYLDSYRFVSDYIYHFFILLLVSATVSLFSLHSRSQIQKIIFIILRFFILFLTGYPLGNNILIELILFTGLIMEIVFSFPGSINLPFLILMNIFFLFTQQEHSAWGTVVSAVEPYKLLCAAAINIIISLIMIFMRVIIETNIKQKNNLNNINNAMRQLADINIGFQNYVKEQEVKVLLEERKRISREIHDTVGNALTNIIMMMEVLQVVDKNENDKIKEVVEGTRAQAQKGLEDTRSAVRQLREQKVAEKCGLNMIAELISAFRLASDIEIAINYGNVPVYIDDKTDLAIFRFIQEGMTNAFRHGMATKISINFWESDGRIRVSIEDNGVGAGEIIEGVGLAGMRERIEGLGGVLLKENLSHGFRIVAVVPSKRENITV